MLFYSYIHTPYYCLIEISTQLMAVTLVQQPFSLSRFSQFDPFDTY